MSNTTIKPQLQQASESDSYSDSSSDTYGGNCLEINTQEFALRIDKATNDPDKRKELMEKFGIMQFWRRVEQQAEEQIKKDQTVQQLETSVVLCSNCGKAGHQVQSCSMQPFQQEVECRQEVELTDKVPNSKKKLYKHRTRRCGHCLKQQGKHWANHWKREDHQGIDPFEAPQEEGETNYDTMNALTCASTFGIQTENIVSLPIMPQTMDIIDEQNEATWEEQKSDSIINQSLLEACLSDEEFKEEEKKKKQYQCPHCDRSYGYSYNLTVHIGKKHQDEAMKNRRELKAKRKKIYLCIYCHRKSSSKKSHKYHLKIAHKEGITVGRPLKNAKKAAINPEKRAKWLLRKIRQRLTFAITGNTGDMRPYLSLLLREKRFKVREKVAKGIRGLICGSAHIPTMDVTSHKKYKEAESKGVPIITVDQLPEATGVSLQELQQDLETLYNEINHTQFRVRPDITHCFWRSKLRFVILSEGAHRALSLKDNFNDALKYGEIYFTTFITRALSALNVKGPQIELFIMNYDQKMHFVGVCRLTKAGMLNTRIFEDPEPTAYVQTQVPIVVAGSVIRNRRQEKEKQEKRKEEEKKKKEKEDKKKQEEEKKKEEEYNQRGGFGFIITHNTTPPATPRQDDDDDDVQLQPHQEQQNLSDSDSSEEEVKQQPLNTSKHNQPALLDLIRNEAKWAVQQRQQEACDYKQKQREAEIDMLFTDRSRERAIDDMIKRREAMMRKRTKKTNEMSDDEYGAEYQSSCNEESDNDDNNDTDNNYSDNMIGGRYRNSFMVQSKDYAIDSGEDDDINAQKDDIQMSQFVGEVEEERMKNMMKQKGEMEMNP